MTRALEGPQATDAIWRRDERPEEGQIVTFEGRDAFVFHRGPTKKEDLWRCILWERA